MDFFRKDFISEVFALRINMPPSWSLFSMYEAKSSHKIGIEHTIGYVKLHLAQIRNPSSTSFSSFSAFSANF